MDQLQQLLLLLQLQRIHGTLKKLPQVEALGISCWGAMVEVLRLLVLLLQIPLLLAAVNLWRVSLVWSGYQMPLLQEY